MDGILLVAGMFAMVGGLAAIVVMLFVQQFRDIRKSFKTRSTSAGEEAREPAFFETPLGQRILALAMLLWSSYFAYQMWGRAPQGEDDHPVFRFLLPMGLVMFLVMLLFPFDMDAQRWKYGTARPRNWSEMPIAWKGGILTGVAAGIVNLIVLALIR